MSRYTPLSLTEWAVRSFKAVPEVRAVTEAFDAEMQDAGQYTRADERTCLGAMLTSLQSHSGRHVADVFVAAYEQATAQRVQAHIGEARTMLVEAFRARINELDGNTPQQARVQGMNAACEATTSAQMAREPWRFGKLSY